MKIGVPETLVNKIISDSKYQIYLQFHATYNNPFWDNVTGYCLSPFYAGQLHKEARRILAFCFKCILNNLCLIRSSTNFIK